MNTHLYGMHVASGGAFLPEHDVVVFDEAHQLEDVISDTAGFAIGAGRFTALARTIGRVVADEGLTARLGAAGDALAGALTASPRPPLAGDAGHDRRRRRRWRGRASTRPWPRCAPSRPTWST